MTATAIQTKLRPWWLMLLEGIALLIIGAVMLWAPLTRQVFTYMFMVQLLGLYWLLRGIFDIVAMFIDRSQWGWTLFMGIIGIIAGGTILMYPIASAVALPLIFVLLLGIWGLMDGIILLILAFRGGGWAAGILGALALVFGIILVANWSSPAMGLTMIWVAAIWGLIGGVVLTVQALRQRNA